MFCHLAAQGEWLRSYSPISERGAEPPAGAEDFGEIPMSKAYVRRISGTHWQ